MDAIKVEKTDVLIVTDVQNCFLPGGSLAAPKGDEVVAPLNRAIRIFQEKKLTVIFTRDWHPPNHCSFRAQGGPWPEHCVQNTEGARFSPDLDVPDIAQVVSKATDPRHEEYSAFQGRDSGGKTMEDILKERAGKRIFIGGVATEYCVFNTVKDALKAGLKVFVLTDAVRGVDVKSGDSARALKEMAESGAELIATDSLA